MSRAVGLCAVWLGILSISAAAIASDDLFVGQIDEAGYELFVQHYPDFPLRERCESLTLTQSELLEMIEAYEKVSSETAYSAWNYTPCFLEGDFAFEGRAAHFNWDPSGHLVIWYPDEEVAETDNYICPGTWDDDPDIAPFYRCDEEYAW